MKCKHKGRAEANKYVYNTTKKTAYCMVCDATATYEELDLKVLEK